MVELTTYPVFLGSFRRDSAQAQGSSSKGVVAWARPHGLPQTTPPRYLLIWKGRVVLETQARFVVNDHEGKELWGRDKLSGSFLVADGDLLYYHNPRRRLDAVQLDNQLKLDATRLPPAYKPDFSVELFVPQAVEFLAVVQAQGEGEMPPEVIVRRNKYDDQYSVWEKEVKGEQALPPLFIPELKRIVVALLLDLHRFDAETGKQEPAVLHGLLRPSSMSADAAGNLYITGQEVVQTKASSVLLSLSPDGKERWRWKGVAKSVQWSRVQPPVLAPGGAVHAFIGNAVLTIQEGKLVWDHELSASPTFGTALSDGTLLVTVSNRLVRLNAKGEEVFSVSLKEPILTPPVVSGSGEIYVATATQLVKIQ